MGMKMPKAYADKAVAAVGTVLKIADPEYITRRRKANNYRSELIGRWMVYTMLKRRGATYYRIGEWYSRDHSTVIAGIQRFEEILATDDKVRSLLNEAEMTMTDYTKQWLIERQQEIRERAVAEAKAKLDARRRGDVEKSKECDRMEPFVSPRWWAEQNKKFVQHMRQVHPEIEWKPMGAR